MLSHRVHVEFAKKAWQSHMSEGWRWREYCLPLCLYCFEL